MTTDVPQIRAFVAVHVPEAVREELRAVQRQFEEAMPEEAVRWTAFEQLNLTLEFLGNVAESEISPLKGALDNVASRHRGFPLAAKSVGAFSSVRNPRVIWAGIVGEVETLTGLQADVRTAVRPWVQEEETRKYRPHLTLGRVRPLKPRDLRKVSAVLAEGESGDFGEWAVEAFHLMQSKLSPHGAQHSVLATFPLQRLQA